jgi:hypothetical protein
MQGTKFANIKHFNHLFENLQQHFEDQEIIEYLQAQAFYMPAKQYYEVRVEQKINKELVFVAPWLIAPDIIPDKEYAKKELIIFFDDLGIELDLIDKNPQFH